MIELENVENYIAPLPVTLITSRLQEDNIKKDNIAVVSWVGVCDNSPNLININLSTGKYTGRVIKIMKEFGVCIPTSDYINDVDFCGCTHGDEVDKFKLTKFTPFEALQINVPLIKECPINMECVLVDAMLFETHEMFIGKIVKTHVDERYLDENGRLDFSRFEILSYIKGEYWALGKKLGPAHFTFKKQ